MVWADYNGVVDLLRSVDWSTSALLCHHTAFDGFILSHHFGVRPAYYLDTLSMARALHSNGIGASLDAVSRFYGVGNKLPNVLDKVKGKRDVPDDLMTQLGQYCALDVELCRMIFDQMAENFPLAELDLIDLTTRMFCDPVLRIDIPRVEVELAREQEEKKRVIEESGVPLEELSSAPKFAALLQRHGIEPPVKTSPRTNEPTWAFSKTDLEFTELAGHSDPKVRKLIAGRLAAKSTIGESRAQRFLAVGKGGQRLPVYLKYFGAHTGRWSAGNSMNLQNLKRGGELRKSILAPEGHMIVVADSAQIEARVLAWLARDHELLGLFRRGEDVYKHMASRIYAKSFEQVGKEERFIGKIATLGLGYGMGWRKFQHTLATGAMGPATDLSEDECRRIVSTYRNTRFQIKMLWSSMDAILQRLIRKMPGEFGPLTFDKENRIWLPNGMYLQYPFLRGDFDVMDEKYVDLYYFDYETGATINAKEKFGAEVKYDKEGGKRIYGGLLTENVVQALSRIIIGDQMLRISNRLKETGDFTEGPWRRIVTMTHDEIVLCVPEAEAQQTLEMMIEEMKTPPDWGSDIPLNAEGGYDACYSK